MFQYCRRRGSRLIEQFGNRHFHDAGHFVTTNSCSAFDKSIQAPVKLLASDGHLDCVKWVFGYEIGVQLVNLLHNRIDVGLTGLGEEQELCAGEGLEALKSEAGRFQNLETRGARAHGRERGCWVYGRWLQGFGGQPASDGVDAVTRGSALLYACWRLAAEGGDVGAWVGIPVECARENQQVIAGELVEARVEFAVVDETPGLVDDKEREDDPGAGQLRWTGARARRRKRRRTHMAKSSRYSGNWRAHHPR